ncbi:hypothetical protein ACFSE1_09055 [Rhizobium helianthi]|uniref:Flagellar FliJ protein n=1 Tax=Rhizobium helianthi TaxID=1132695 RepID=A0ABW4M4Z0_9HYPH
MDRFSKDYALLLKIRSIRAEKAERKMAEADARRDASLAKLQAADHMAATAQAHVAEASLNRRRLTSRQVSGAELQQLRSAEVIARARMEDRAFDVLRARAEVEQRTSEAEVSRALFAKAHRMVIKTETIIDELKTGEVS